MLLQYKTLPHRETYANTEKRGGDMFQTLLTTLQKLALLKAGVKSCILYSTNVPVHLHLHLFKINVALKDNNMHRFSMFT